MTPTIPLDLFPLDGASSLLRWGPLDDGDGTPTWLEAGRLLAISGHTGNVCVTTGAEIPLRGLALDAVLRSVGVALGWAVTEDGPGPVLVPIGAEWLLEWPGCRQWFAGAERTACFVVPGLSVSLPYPEAVALIARAVAGRAP